MINVLDKNNIRSAKENDFPYTMSTVCYFEVYKDGIVKRIHHKRKCDFGEVQNAYENAKKKKQSYMEYDLVIGRAICSLLMT